MMLFQWRTKKRRNYLSICYWGRTVKSWTLDTQKKLRSVRITRTKFRDQKRSFFSTKNTNIYEKRCCRPGSNWRPSVCKTDVITTTPRQLFVFIWQVIVFILYKTLNEKKSLSIPSYWFQGEIFGRSVWKCCWSTWELILLIMCSKIYQHHAYLKRTLIPNI